MKVLNNPTKYLILSERVQIMVYGNGSEWFGFHIHAHIEIWWRKIFEMRRKRKRMKKKGKQINAYIVSEWKNLNASEIFFFLYQLYFLLFNFLSNTLNMRCLLSLLLQLLYVYCCWHITTYITISHVHTLNIVRKSFSFDSMYIWMLSNTSTMILPEKKTI